MLMPETYWLLWSVALALLGLSALIGEFSLLPWLALSVASAGASAFLGGSTDSQLFWFSIVLVLSVVASRMLFRQGNDGRSSITETVEDMIGVSLKVDKIDKKNDSCGEASSSTGKIWTIEHARGESLKDQQSVTCVASKGVSLLVE